METELYPAEHHDVIRKALRTLRAGGLVAFPTDTVYGLGADAFDVRAILRLFEAKGRASEKAIPVLLGKVEHLSQVAHNVPEMAAKLASRFWPGPLTLVIGRREELPSELGPEPTVGVRIPNHPMALALLAASGPLAVTSANLTDQPNAYTAQEVMQALGGRIELVLDGGRTPAGRPSTVVDCTGDGVRILRAGPITEAQILEALR